MAVNKINEARLRLIQKRQLRDAWGKDYQAAIWATPAEAPSISTPTILHPAKLGGRPMHTLSRPETWTALLALYHPGVWDIHEQRILYPGPRPHFLDGHRLTVGQAFRHLRGTLTVAEEMGCLSKTCSLKTMSRIHLSQHNVVRTNSVALNIGSVRQLLWPFQEDVIHQPIGKGWVCGSVIAVCVNKWVLTRQNKGIRFSFFVAQQVGLGTAVTLRCISSNT